MIIPYRDNQNMFDQCIITFHYSLVCIIFNVSDYPKNCKYCDSSNLEPMWPKAFSRYIIFSVLCRVCGKITV